jgi:hypothetical protein
MPSDYSWTTKRMANAGQRCITQPCWSHSAQSKRWPTEYTICFKSRPPIPSFPSVLSASARTSRPIISRWQCAKVWSCQGSSTQPTAPPVSAPTHYELVELWPYDSTMLVKTSSIIWVDGPAPRGSRISMLHFLPSPQVCPNAWWCTMCFIALAHNPMILHRGSYRFPVAALMNKAPPKYIIGVPCWLAYCTSDAALNSTTTDLRIGRGGHPVWPVPT